MHIKHLFEIHLHRARWFYHIPYSLKFIIGMNYSYYMNIIFTGVNIRSKLDGPEEMKWMAF